MTQQNGRQSFSIGTKAGEAYYENMRYPHP